MVTVPAARCTVNWPFSKPMPAPENIRHSRSTIVCSPNNWPGAGPRRMNAARPAKAARRHFTDERPAARAGLMNAGSIDAMSGCGSVVGEC